MQISAIYVKFNYVYKYKGDNEMLNNGFNGAASDSGGGFYCKKCGRFLKTGMKFCGGCGSSVVESEQNNSASDSFPSEEFFCPQCGAVLKEGVKFCESCGLLIDWGLPVVENVSEEKNADNSDDKTESYLSINEKDSIEKTVENIAEPSLPEVTVPAVETVKAEMQNDDNSDDKTESVFGAEENAGSEKVIEKPVEFSLPEAEVPAVEAEKTESFFVSEESSGSEDVFCENCGSKIKSGLTFCQRCGAPVKDSALSEKSDEIAEKDAVESSPKADISPVFSLGKAIVCKNCGSIIEAGKKFCEKCGLPAELSIPPKKNEDKTEFLFEGADSGSGKEIFCSVCGSKVLPGKDFCEECGARIGAVAPEEKGDGYVPSDFIQDENLTRVVPIENEIVDNGMESAVCYVCGSYLKPGLKFCEKCGAAAGSKNTVPEPPVVTGFESNITNSNNNDSICPNCGKAVKAGMRFCTGCGYSFEDYSANSDSGKSSSLKEDYDDILENYDEESTKKKNTSKTFLIILITSLVLIIGAVVVLILFWDKFFPQEPVVPTTVEDFQKNIEEHTKKGILDIKCEDFDGDGTKEAFAIVGTKNVEKGGFKNAELWYADADETKALKKNMYGHSNGLIDSGTAKYISLEVENDAAADDDTAPKTLSYVFGVSNEESYEAEISGKYSDVHQDGNKVVCIDKKGNTLEIKEGKDNWSVTQTGRADDDETSGEALTKEQVETFENMFTALMWNLSMDYPDGFDSLTLNDAYRAVLSDLYSVYYCYFDDETRVFFDDVNPVKDPRAMLRDEGDNSSGSGKWYAYVCRDADKVDWILKNILNVKPDRNKYDEGSLTSGGVEYYLEGGCYYTETGAYGDSITNFLLKDYEFIGNGKYNLILEEENSSAKQYKAVSELKEIDGEKFLTLISLEID